MPLGGRCSSLPCTLDTTSILKDAIAVYNSLSLVFRNWMTISTNGMLSMVAQCAYLASYKDPLVVRQGVMLRSTSSSQPVDCSTPQPSTVPRPSSTVPFGPSFLPRVPISPSHTNTARTLCGVTNAICVRAILMICWFNVHLYWPIQYYARKYLYAHMVFAQIWIAWFKKA